MVPVKHLSNFQRTLEMSLINSENSRQFKLYNPVLTLYIIKLLKQLESTFKRTIKCNKYLSKKPMKRKTDIQIF